MSEIKKNDKVTIINSRNPTLYTVVWIVGDKVQLSNKQTYIPLLDISEIQLTTHQQYEKQRNEKRRQSRNY